MIRAYWVADVRVVEEAAMAELPDGVLMQRAAQGLADIAMTRAQQRGAQRVVALVGAGNNGGDTLYAAAHLAAAGYSVSAICASSGTIHPGGTQAAEDAGIDLLAGALDDSVQQQWRAHLSAAEIVIDGITGIGGRPGLREEARAWVEAIPDPAYIVAVDLPSGVDPDGMIGTADCVFADETVTFGEPKPCHLLPATEPMTGRLSVVDIGLDFSGCTPAVTRLTHDDVAGLWPRPSAATDKYSRGVLGAVVGSTAYPGAAVLSALGALGVGTGMVRHVAPPAVVALVHQHAPEVVAAPGRVQAWVLGSGVDPAAETKAGGDGQVAAIESALAASEPCVVDAGALDLIGRREDSPVRVLTPHAGELARLLTRLEIRVEGAGAGETGAAPGAPTDPVTRDQVLAAPVAHAQAAADELKAVVLLKGATTLVVCPSSWGQPVCAQADAPPWLATAGAGDVLGGILGALLASGLEPADAAALAALVHGVAADQVNPGGPVRVLDLARSLPHTVAALLGDR
ncbi:MAG: NAD(P)H-hydrate epimerase [Actinomycetales bacterium]|nr:MAG: NAD(P)H-hydrate epimerase [Actinomycetales bacterium]